MKTFTACFLAAIFLCRTVACLAAEPDNTVFTQRIAEALKPVQITPAAFDPKKVDQADRLALLLLYKNENVGESNRLVLAYCGADPMTTYVGKPVPKNRSEALLRIYLLERTRKLLSPEARRAIEDHAWNLLNKYNRNITRADADKRFFPDFDSSENHYLNDRRRYHLSLQIVRMSERHGPNAKLAGETIDSHCRAWDAFWIHYFRDRANEGTDIEVAHPSSYGLCTIGVYYDLYDLADTAEVRELAGKFLTLFWAEVAGEFEPRTGERAGLAATRAEYHEKSHYWAQSLLYCYRWHDNAFVGNDALGLALFLASGYRPPEILSAIAHDPNRGCYLATSRRAGMLADGNKQGWPIIFDESGGSCLRRDVYYTPDYALSTITYDPKRTYRSSIILSQVMGATFASDPRQRIVVFGNGYYANRAISGITGKQVSIIARDPNAVLGRDRFMSLGTRIFISNGALWDNRVEDKSGWFFTRAGDAYTAIRPATGGYQINDKSFTFNGAEVGRKVTEVVEKNGHFLDLTDMWAPIVIQMGRAADYKSIDDFQASVKAKRLEYADGKLTYVSEAKDTYEVWTKGAQLPRINGAEVDLNPPKTFDSPFLSMVHGRSKAVITYPGHKERVLDFGEPQSH